MASVTLTTLRARVRELSDTGSSTFVTDASTSLDAFINTGVAKLHDLVANTDGDNLPDSTSTSGNITLTLGTGTIALPADFDRFLGLDINFQGSTLDVARFNWKQRNQLRAQGGYAWGQSTPRYTLQGSNLRVNGQDGTYAYVLWYSPGATVLSAGSDAINYPNGYEHYAILYAAILVAQKEETDAGLLMGLLAEERSRIEDSISRRDSANPKQMVDVESPYTNSGSPWSW